MPITIKPRKAESQSAFVDRCKVDGHVTLAAKNRAGGNERKAKNIAAAICQDIWHDHQGEAGKQ